LWIAVMVLDTFRKLLFFLVLGPEPDVLQSRDSGGYPAIEALVTVVKMVNGVL
jgi:hypothetical protein